MSNALRAPRFKKKVFHSIPTDSWVSTLDHGEEDGRFAPVLGTSKLIIN